MINLALAESLFSLVLLLIAYFISITINGMVQTYVAYKMGDDTPYEAGYGSPNPLAHFELFSFLAVLIFRIGWPQMVPVNPFAILGRFRLVRLLVIHATEAITSLLLALGSLVLSVGLFGHTMTMALVLKVFSYYSKSLSLLFSSTPQLNIASMFQGDSTVLVIGAFLLTSMVYLNIFIATISLILNGLRYALLVGFEKGYKYIEYADYLSLFGPLVIVYFFADPLGYYLLKTTIWGACKIALMFGAYRL
jgi:hypothetical protein